MEARRGKRIAQNPPYTGNYYEPSKLGKIVPVSGGREKKVDPMVVDI